MRNRPISQVEIEQKIMLDIEAMEEATEEFDKLSEEAARAEVEYKVARARAYLRQRGSIKDREYAADEITREEMESYKISEGRLKAQREVLNTIRARLDALRSLNSNLRSQV
jgi:hypothetical protein